MANSQKPEFNRTQRLVVCTDNAGEKGCGKPNGYQQERELVRLTGPVPDVKFTFDCSPKALPIDKLLEDTPSLQGMHNFNVLVPTVLSSHPFSSHSSPHTPKSLIGPVIVHSASKFENETT